MELVIEKVTKKFGKEIFALQDFSLKVQTGILGLIGPNGAGKSTLMRILATITRATSGTVYLDKEDISENPEVMRTVLGYLPQDFGVYPNLNAIEFLKYMAALKGVHPRAAKTRINELLQLTNLMDVHKRPLSSYSGGMKQRIGIAQALINDPRILIVDEPTSGSTQGSNIPLWTERFEDVFFSI